MPSNIAERISGSFAFDERSRWQYEPLLVQVLMNLVTNGVKYNDNGGDGKLEITAAKADGFVRFTIRDNGPGIATLYHAKVFEMYQRLSHGEKSGSGMGLAIVKKLVHRHGGEISLESDSGKGATFSFTWSCEEEVDQIGILVNGLARG